MLELLVKYWEYILIGFMIVEKLVKISSAKWDDIVVDGIKSILTKLKNIK